MWKWKEEEKPPTPLAKPLAPAGSSALPDTSTPLGNNVPKEATVVETFRAEVAHIGKSVIIKGQLSGSEDLYLDGEVEGSIELRGHSLTVGPNGRVRANIQAKDVVLHGKVDGNVYGVERVELKKSAVLVGDVQTRRIVIEDGAYFKGSIDIQREAPKEAAKETPKLEPVTAAPAAATATASAASGVQGILLDPKK